MRGAAERQLSGPRLRDRLGAEGALPPEDGEERPTDGEGVLGRDGGADLVDGDGIARGWLRDGAGACGRDGADDPVDRTGARRGSTRAGGSGREGDTRSGGGLAAVLDPRLTSTGALRGVAPGVGGR